MEKMREEFEAWISHYIGGSWLKPDPARSGEYFDNGAQSMLESWQASRSALCVKMPRCWNDEQRDYRDGMIDSLNDAGVSHE